MLFLENSIYPAAEEVTPIDINPFTGFSFSIWLLGVCMCFGRTRTIRFSIMTCEQGISPLKIGISVNVLCFSTCTHVHTHITTVHRLISSWSPSQVPLCEQTSDQATDTGNSHAQAGYVQNQYLQSSHLT